MSLLQIHEPGETPEPHHQEPGLAIGIDLGTTHSVVAVVGNAGTPEIIKDEDGISLLPSIVAYPDNGEVLVGQMALEYMSVDPARVVASVKTLMGRGLNDLGQSNRVRSYHVSSDRRGMVKLVFGETQRSPVEISAEILRSLKQKAETALAQPIDRAVITVPAYFDDGARQATKEAARLAGIQVLRLINEPTAAALAYGLDGRHEGCYAIYDLGGGTFDISILRLEKGVFRVLATGGDTALGGDDIDQAIIDHVLEKLPVKRILTPSEMKLALRDARRAKEQLSYDEEAEFYLGVGYPVRITRTEFDQLIEPILARTMNTCRQVLLDSGLTIKDIQGIVLVGGSTRIPAVRRKVAEYFGQTPLSDIDPDLVVAEGAALQAHALTRGSDNLLLDVLPLSLGLEMMGGIVEKVVDRNTPIPVAKSQDFTTYQDGQTGMILHVVQGERETVDNCRSLARFELTDIPPMVAGAARIRVTFTVDADGLLTVSAEERTTNKAASIEVKPSFGLTDDDMARMLSESFEHGREDIERRMLIEARVEAERVVLALDAAMKADAALLEKEEMILIKDIKTKLLAATKGEDRDLINGYVERLEKATHPFAQRRMDRAVALALKGHKLDEIEADMATPSITETDI